MAQNSTSLLARAIIKIIVNIAVVWFLTNYFSQYFTLTGGLQGVVIAGLLLGVLNILVRPVLEILTLPIKLFATLIAVIIVHGVLIQVAVWLLQQPFNSTIVLTINGGLVGWVFTMCIIGVSNWVAKEAT